MAGVVAVALCALMLGTVLTLCLCQAEIGRAWRRVRDRVAPPPQAPVGPAIEDVARALRRLRPQVLTPAPGEAMARRRGTAAAYDDLLGQAARALGVPDELSGLPEGTDRDAERLRLEHLLREAGLALG
ncbi:hypothetical protein J2X46_000763 [Nocardioides sp. BE266]|uniref:hypothetical protein n=1 Tax=Nocardioides sp. BE266 TaxID=2817725 RepID=UPI002859781C|nr:hypothetical protein [Nocardioides sp. BE266]MDR7251791.1 hypothetical protein [Nocardioides sp. BE266]